MHYVGGRKLLPWLAPRPSSWWLRRDSLDRSPSSFQNVGTNGPGIKNRCYPRDVSMRYIKRLHMSGLGLLWWPASHELLQSLLGSMIGCIRTMSSCQPPIPHHPPITSSPSPMFINIAHIIPAFNAIEMGYLIYHQPPPPLSLSPFHELQKCLVQKHSDGSLNVNWIIFFLDFVLADVVVRYKSWMMHSMFSLFTLFSYHCYYMCSRHFRLKKQNVLTLISM